MYKKNNFKKFVQEAYQEVLYYYLMSTFYDYVLG